MKDQAKEGDMISLQKQDVKVVKCEECGALMVNIDADEVAQGDLTTLKRKGVRLSNPETEKQVCLKCEYTPKKSFGEKLSEWFDTDTEDEDDDDSSFFHSTPSISTPIFGGSHSGGGF